MVARTGRLIVASCVLSLATLCVLATAAAADLLWQPDERLTNDPQDSFEPAAAIGPDGDFHVVWADRRTGVPQLFYKRWDGTGWTSDVRLSPSALYQIEPGIAVGPDGTVHVVWLGQQAAGQWTYEVRCKHWDGAVWTADELLTSTPTISNLRPVVEVDSNGLVHVVWAKRDPEEELYTRRWNGSTWTAAERLSNADNESDYPDLAADQNGNVHLVWEDWRGYPQDPDIYYRRWDGAAWGPEQLLVDEGHYQNFPAVAVDPSGRVHVVWEDNRYEVPYPGHYRSIMYKRWDGTAWTAEEVVATGGPHFRKPEIAADINGNVHVVWERHPNGYEFQANLQYRRWNGTTWSSIVDIVNMANASRLPQILADQNASVHVIWQDDRSVQDYPEIYHKVGMFNLIAAGPVPSCISIDHPCITVPVRITRGDATPIRGYSVELTLSPELALCGAGISQGTYMSGVGTTAFQVLGTNPYTVDCAVLGLPCGATATPGTLFNLEVTNTGADGMGTIAIGDVTIRDCLNAPVSGGGGAPTAVTIDNTMPAAVADLAVAQVKTGNDANGTTKVSLAFALPADADSVFVWRKGYGAYPEYDDGGGSVPVVPAGYPPAGWVRAYRGRVNPGVDEPATRDYWYYLVYAKDACGNMSPPSNLGGGCLNYHLGDVSNGSVAGAGDNDVEIADISLLGDHYREQPFPGAYNYLDVGPTTDYTVDGRPTTDNEINFEDLMMFAINHGQVGLVGNEPQVTDVPDVRLLLQTEATAEGLVARLVLAGNEGVVKGIQARLDLGGTLEVIAVEEGALLGAQAAPVFFERVDGGIDCAVLGAEEVLRGSGEVAVFRLRGRGTVTLTAADLRDVRNQAVGTVAAGAEPGATPMPAELAMFAARPNPFNPSTTLTFRLPEGSRATLAIYDVTGALVRRLVDGKLGAGEHVACWDGRSDRGQAVGSGVYVARLTAGGRELTQKLQLLK